MPGIPESLNTEDELPVFDKEGSLWRLGGDEELYEELMNVFIEEIPELLKKINSFFESGDYSSLEHESHSLKGSAAAVGAILVSECAAKLEIAAKNREESNTIFLLINKIEQEIYRAQKYFKKV